MVHILWIDYEPHMIRDLVHSLSGPEYQVTLIRDAKSLTRLDRQFDLLIVEIVPDDIGVEFLRRVRSGEFEAFGLSAKISTIVLSAAVDALEMRTATALVGEGNFLLKPADPATLIEKIRGILH